jgi:hypothetical protein
VLDPDRGGDEMAGYGAGAALASGALAALGAVSLILFAAVGGAGLGPFAAEPSAFVRLSDALSGVAALVAIVVAVKLHAAWRQQATGASRTALTIGVASLTGYAVVVLSYAAGINEPAIQGPLTVVGIGGIGLWIALISLGRADPAVAGAVRGVGIAVGVGDLLLVAAYFLGGEASRIGSQELTPLSLLILLAYAAGAISSQFGYPIWALWLGRRWRSGRAYRPEVSPTSAA